jgi:Zn-dependent membrane protease YugP
MIIPALILVLCAQFAVKGTYRKYSRVQSRAGQSGAAVARRLLDRHGLYDVPVERIRGNLTDHYDPRHRAVRLSEGVYDGASIASVAVAAHETGHAVQHAEHYAPLAMRSAILPVASFGSSAGVALFLLGLFIQAIPFLMELGIVLFACAVLFQVVTLPVEFNASSRALEFLGSEAILNGHEENSGARKMLNAAALTYVAAAIMAVLQLLRFVLIASGRN